MVPHRFSTYFRDAHPNYVVFTEPAIVTVTTASMIEGIIVRDWR